MLRGALGDRTAETMAKMNSVAEARQEEWINSQDGHRIMARETGGLFIRHHNYVNLSLQEAARDGETYYLIGYRPDAETVAEMQGGKSKYHNLKVRVKRPGLQVRSRSGFSSATEIPYAPAPSADPMCGGPGGKP